MVYVLLSFFDTLRTPGFNIKHVSCGNFWLDFVTTYYTSFTMAVC